MASQNPLFAKVNRLSGPCTRPARAASPRANGRGLRTAAWPLPPCDAASPASSGPPSPARSPRRPVPGRFARARRQTASRAGGTSGQTCRGGPAAPPAPSRAPPACRSPGTAAGPSGSRRGWRPGRRRRSGVDLVEPPVGLLGRHVRRRAQDLPRHGQVGVARLLQVEHGRRRCGARPRAWPISLARPQSRTTTSPKSPSTTFCALQVAVDHAAQWA